MESHFQYITAAACILNAPSERVFNYPWNLIFINATEKVIEIIIVKLEEIKLLNLFTL